MAHMGLGMLYPLVCSAGDLRCIRGVANYESMSSILGFELDKSTGKFCYVPERLPDVWYRRATPYTAVDVAANLVPTFLAGPPVGALLTHFEQIVSDDHCLRRHPPRSARS